MDEIKRVEVLSSTVLHFHPYFVEQPIRPIRVLVLNDTSGSLKGKVGDSLSEIAILTTVFAVDSTPANARIASGGLQSFYNFFDCWIGTAPDSRSCR